MSEYLKRENVLGLAVSVPECFSKMISTWDVVHMPAENVAEVVRCKDCVFYENGFCFSRYVGYGAVTPQRNPNDFCSHGERRDKDE